MKHYSKAVVLSLLVGLLVIGAGCSGILSDDDFSREIRLVNQDNTDHAVVVEIADGSRLVYSEGRMIDAETGITLDQFNQTGEYEVTVAVDGNSTTIDHTFEREDNAVPTSTIGIDNQGAVTVE